MKKPLLIASMLLSGMLVATAAFTNESLIYYQSDFSDYTMTKPLGDWSCFGSGKKAQDITVGKSSMPMREFFPIGGDAFTPINFDDFGWVYCSNSTTVEGGPADEWLVSPKIDISGIPEDILLSFDVFAYGSETQPKYEVYYSTTGNNKEDFKLLYTGRSSNNPSYPECNRKYLSLSDLNGSDLYLAFVNKSRNAQLLGFKDIRLAEYELAVVNSTPNYVNVGGDYYVQLSVGIMTPKPCDGFTMEVSTSNDAASQSYVTKKQIGFGYTTSVVDFAEPITIKLDESIEYSTTIVPNYEGATPSTFQFDISCAAGFPAVCVEEEATGTWCGWCVRGIAALNQFADEYGDRFIGIAVHGSSDPMKIDNYITPLSEQGNITGYPSAWLNRSVKADPYSRETVEALISENVGYSVEIKKVKYDEKTKRVDVTYAVKLAYSTNSANLTAVVVVTEDKVTGRTPEWNQTNYYSGASQSSVAEVYGEAAWNYFEYFCTKGSVVPFTQMSYDHVAQGIFNNYYGGGKGGDLPTQWVINEEQEFTMSFDMPLQQVANSTGVQNWLNTHMVVMLLDAVTGRVLNADKVGAISYESTAIGEIADDADFHVIASNGTISVEAPAGAEISVFNVNGYRLIGAIVGEDGRAVLETSGMSGVMVVRVSDGVRSYVKKVML